MHFSLIWGCTWSMERAERHINRDGNRWIWKTKAVVTSTWADFRQYQGNQMQTAIQARQDDPDEPLGIGKVINKPGKSEKAKQQQNVCNLFLLINLHRCTMLEAWWTNSAELTKKKPLIWPWKLKAWPLKENKVRGHCKKSALIQIKLCTVNRSLKAILVTVKDANMCPGASGCQLKPHSYGHFWTCDRLNAPYRLCIRPNKWQQTIKTEDVQSWKSWKKQKSGTIVQGRKKKKKKRTIYQPLTLKPDWNDLQ